MAAMIDYWARVTARLQDQESALPGLHRLVAPMLRLVDILREDPRLASVVPGLSHLSVTLRVHGIARYVIGEWQDREPWGYAVSFVDPPFEISGERIVPEAEVADTIVAYLAQLSHDTASRREG